MNTLLTTFGPTDSLLRSLFGSTQEEFQGMTESRIRPRVDIHEFDDRFEIHADLPGVRKEDLSVELDKGQLLLKAKRESAHSDKSHSVRRERLERVEYVRSFHIGELVEPEQVKGEMADGVLTLTLPKRERALPRRIEVK